MGNAGVGVVEVFVGKKGACEAEGVEGACVVNVSVGVLKIVGVEGAGVGVCSVLRRANMLSASC